MSDFGFSEDDLGDNTDDIADPEVPEDPDPITQPGDLFQLGDHRLLCGDSTNSEDIARLTGRKQGGLSRPEGQYFLCECVQSASPPVDSLRKLCKACFLASSEGSMDSI